MRQSRIAAMAAVTMCCGVLLVGQSIFAQQFGRARPPRQYRGVTNEPYVSPYLNLVRPGADPGFNYSTLVQPELQQWQFNQQQQGAVQGLNQRLQQQQAEMMTPYGPVGRIRPTGGRADYMNYSHYYPGLSAGPSGGGRRYNSSLSGGGMGMNIGGMGGAY